MKKIILSLILLIFMTIPLLSLAEQPTPSSSSAAADITASCKFTATRKDTLFRLTDGKTKMTFEGNNKKQNWIEVTTPADQPACGIYIVWTEGGTSQVSLQSYNEATGEFEQAAILNRGEYLHEYTRVDHLTRFRLVSTDEKGTVPVAEMKLVGEGDILPEDIQDWQPSCTDADLLVYIAHPDDEYIFMGGTIPWYSVEKELHVAVAWMTLQNETRLHELLNALWTGGCHEYPYLLRFFDKLSDKTRVIYKYWDEQAALDAVAKLIDTCQPNVVVTHDINGEYGHGAHMACADLMLRVIRDGERTTDWQVKKLYLHLWAENQITIEWDRVMKNGRTALEMAQTAFKCHKSQQGFDTKTRGGKTFKFEVKAHGMFDNSDYGLAFTTVGADAACDDFFENVAPKESTCGAGKGE